MTGWFRGRYKSIKFRLLFAFTLVLVTAFLALGWHLDRSYIVSKQQILQQQLEAQHIIFNLCLGRAQPVATEKLLSCYKIQRQTAQTDLYFYSKNSVLVAAFKTENQFSDTPLSPVQDDDKQRLEQWLAALKNTTGQPLIRLNGFYFNSSSPNVVRTFIIAMPSWQMDADILRNRLTMSGFLSALLLLLVIGCYLQLKRGLQPLDKMVTDLEAISSGTAAQLSSEYATEFNAMRESLNNLLNAERLQRERYRNTLADLAHSLKTPLAVMQGATSENLDYQAYLNVAGEQIRRMDQIIQYQLTRAVKSIGDGAKAKAVQANPIIERILSALGKVYREKEVRVILNLERNIEINADERDLMEMLGNMLENAFKYCRSEVAVSLYSDNHNVFIILEDDGAGVSEDMRKTILERGERADTSAAPGQGIGLSVSVDILSSYSCQLEVEDSFSLGGAKFSITFPKH
ncbi:MAG: sensory transduction histidine kinase [Osedax symbiont Rs1]|nr:MAG: sensory transduction histidine kinase [Osedax symbiont Rs1]